MVTPYEYGAQEFERWTGKPITVAEYQKPIEELKKKARARAPTAPAAPTGWGQPAAPTPPTKPERWFWPGEAPPGQEGFLWPWEPTPQPVEMGMPPGFYEDPFNIPPEVSANYPIVYDPAMMAWRVGGMEPGVGATGISEYEQQRLALEERRVALEEEEATWRRQQAGELTPEQEEYYRLQYARLEQDMALAEQQMTPQWRPGELGLQQQQLAQQQQYQQWQMGQAERQYGAQLAAQPRSWLEYAAYTGEQPGIQPWMLPLMPQQYGQLQAGGAIPGYAPESMGGMPQLLTPSAQYQARMGPTAMQQYQGYQQARTGVLPEETQFRLWSGAPPGGQYGGLTYGR